jgi:hypothetical protein
MSKVVSGQLQPFVANAPKNKESRRKINTYVCAKRAFLFVVSFMHKVAWMVNNDSTESHVSKRQPASRPTIGISRNQIIHTITICLAEE